MYQTLRSDGEEKHDQKLAVQFSYCRQLSGNRKLMELGAWNGSPSKMTGGDESAISENMLLFAIKLLIFRDIWKIQKPQGREDNELEGEGELKGGGR